MSEIANALLVIVYPFAIAKRKDQYLIYYQPGCNQQSSVLDHLYHQIVCVLSQLNIQWNTGVCC